MDKFSKFGHFIEETLITVLLLFMVCTVFVEVVARKMGVGIQWAQESTLLANAWLVLIGASYCVREKAHICVDIIMDKLKGNVAKTVLLVAIICCIVYCLLFLYGSVIYVSKMKKFGMLMQDIPIQRWIAQTCLIFGFSLLILRFLEAAYRVAFKNDTKVLRQIGEAEESMVLADSLKDMAEKEALKNEANNLNNASKSNSTSSATSSTNNLNQKINKEI